MIIIIGMYIFLSSVIIMIVIFIPPSLVDAAIYHGEDATEIIFKYNVKTIKGSALYCIRGNSLCCAPNLRFQRCLLLHHCNSPHLGRPIWSSRRKPVKEGWLYDQSHHPLFVSPPFPLSVLVLLFLPAFLEAYWVNSEIFFVCIKTFLQTRRFGLVLPCGLWDSHDGCSSKRLVSNM